MKEFLQPDSDQVSNSLKQIPKITCSDQFSDSLVSTPMLCLREVYVAYQSINKKGGSQTSAGSSSTLVDKLFTTTGSGFTPAIVGSWESNSSNNVIVLDMLTSIWILFQDGLMWFVVIGAGSLLGIVSSCLSELQLQFIFDKTMEINTQPKGMSVNFNFGGEKRKERGLKSKMDSLLFLKSLHFSPFPSKIKTHKYTLR